MRKTGVTASGLLCAGLFASPTAWAEAPRAEASAFLGMGVFSEDIELGNSWAAEQVPSTAPVLGVRLGWTVLPTLPARLALVVEGELALATSFTGGSQFEGAAGRMSYFAPVLGWRAHAVLRWTGSPRVRPHLVVGGGGATVASSSPYMAKETDPVAYWGPGVAVPVGGRWQLRADVRHGVMPARDAGATSTLEVQLGVAATLGAGARARVPEPEPVVVVDDLDLDEPPVPPPPPSPPDRDGDTIVDAADACPDVAEDRDGFDDADGCPDLDDDGDGLADAADRCPREPEPRNGIDDDDGCPDTLPADVTGAIAAMARLRFEPGRARVTPAARELLATVQAMLLARKDVRVTITGRAPRAGGDELARRRAEAVKWFLVERGVRADRITTRVGEPGEPAVELAIATHE